MLAVMEATDLTHGPLEFLFTIDEETGLTGASELEASLVEGRQLINLDSEKKKGSSMSAARGWRREPADAGSRDGAADDRYGDPRRGAERAQGRAFGV